MTRLVLGNRHAIHSRDNGETWEALPKAKRATVIEIPDGQPMAETFINITRAEGLWTKHATDGATPAWVAADSPGLAALLSEHFGGIEVRQLLDPFDPTTAKPKGGRGGRAVRAQMLTVLFLGLALAKVSPLLKTNAGNDVQAAQMAGSASATAVLKWVAITANATAPAGGDTTLTAEITTAGGGLLRKVGTYAHTTGAASYTITTTFTANGSDALPVTIAKRGIFDAASAGNMGFETLVVPTATLSAAGDNVTLTDTITM